MRTQELFNFMKERHEIYVDRFERRYPAPWTNDPILQEFRFCNVYRELDTQTKWFAENWRDPNEYDADLWFASLVFRLVNWHETAEELGYPVPFEHNKFERILFGRKQLGKKVYSGAYMISTHGVTEPKHSYLRKSLLKVWNEREKIRYQPKERLADFHKRLMNCFDVGSFIAAQVIADCKYAAPWKGAPDWYTFAASGPGSRRGLNRVMCRPPKQSYHENTWRADLGNLHSWITPLIHKAGMPRLHAQDLQNCLCEFDKYERVRLGEGRPKQRFKPKSEEELS